MYMSTIRHPPQTFLVCESAYRAHDWTPFCAKIIHEPVLHHHKLYQIRSNMVPYSVLSMQELTRRGPPIRGDFAFPVDYLICGRARPPLRSPRRCRIVTGSSKPSP